MRIVEDISNQFARFVDRTSLLVEILIRTQQYFIYLAEAAIKANEAFITLNKGLQDLYVQIPRTLTGFTAMAQAVETTTRALTALTAATTSVGESFYTNIITASIQTGNAATVLTGSVEALGSAFSAAGQAASAAGEAVQAFSNVLERGIEAISTPLTTVSESLNQFMQNALQSITSMREALRRPFEGIENIFRGEGWRESIRGLEDLQNKMDRFASTMSSSSAQWAENTNRALDSLRQINQSFLRIADTIGAYYETQVRRILAAVQRELTTIMRELAPLLEQLRGLQMRVQGVALVLSAVLSIISVLLNAISQFLGILGRFVGAWLQVVQTLSQTQQAMNILSIQVQNLSQLSAEGVERFDAYSKALSLVTDAAARANVSLSAVSETMQSLSIAGIVPTTRLLSELTEVTQEFAARLGVLPDEAMRNIEAFIQGQGTLSRYHPALGRGAFETWLYLQTGFLRLPPPLAAAAGLQFLQTALPNLVGGAAPATLVQFTQALNTLGQQLRALFAQATPLGGAKLLEEIRDLLRELVTGEIGRNLRQFFTFISTGVATAVKNILGGMKELFASAQFQELGRGIGLLLQAIGIAVREVLGKITSAFTPEQIRNFFVNLGASIAGFIAGAMEFIPRAIAAIARLIQNVFGQGGIFNFITLIIQLLTQGIRIGVMLFEVGVETAQAVAKAIQPMLEWLNRLTRSAERISAAIRVVVSLVAAIAQVVAGKLLGGPVGAMLGMLFGGMTLASAIKDLMAAWKGGDQLGDVLGDVGKELQEKWGKVKEEIEKAKQSLTQVAPGLEGLPKHLQSFSNEITAAAAAGANAFKETSQKVKHLLLNSAAEWANAAQESATQLRRVFQYMGNLVEMAWTQIEPFVTAGRRLGVLAPAGGFAGIAPFGIPLALPAPGGAFMLGGISPAAATAAVTAALREQLRFDIATLLQLQARQGIGVAISEGQIEQIRNRILKAMEEILNAINQGLSETLQNIETRVNTIINTIRVGVLLGFGGPADILRGYVQGLSVTLQSLREVGFTLGQLAALPTLYPGIENTAYYAQLVNQHMEGILRASERLADAFIKSYEMLRRLFGLSADINTLFAGWGFNLERAKSALQAMLEGDIVGGMLLFASAMESVRGDIVRTARQMADASRETLRALQAEVSMMFADAFGQLIRGNIEGYIDGLRNAFTRAFDLVNEYSQRLRRLMELYLTPIRLVRENFDELRGLLATIGAEMALFPYAINTLIPALMEARNVTIRWMQEAMALGDILQFREAHRSLVQIQRQIMELLGLGGMFLPAFTPEQMVRMLVRLGAPTVREAVEIARGRTLMEPIGFRAVPIPLSMIYGIPYSPGVMYRPDIFGGFAAAMQGMTAITPQAVQGQIQRMVTESMLRGAEIAFAARGVQRQALAELSRGMMEGFGAALSVHLQPVVGELSRLTTIAEQIYRLLYNAYNMQVAGAMTGGTALPFPYGVTMPAWGVAPAPATGVTITLPPIRVVIPITADVQGQGGSLGQRTFYLVLSNRGPVGG